MTVYAYDDLFSLKKSPYLASYKVILNELLGTTNNPALYIDVEKFFRELPCTTIFMVEEKDEIVAIARVSKMNNVLLNYFYDTGNHKNTMLVTSVYTKSTHRKEGHGKKIMQSICKVFPDNILETYSHWIPATTLYLSVGYKPVDSRTDGTGHVILFKKGKVAISYLECE